MYKVTVGSGYVIAAVAMAQGSATATPQGDSPLQPRQAS